MTGQTVKTGYLYYANSHQRQPVEISAKLREDAIATIESVTALLETGQVPKAMYTKRCAGCSLYSQCLPQAADRVGRYQEAD
jgi:CRISPR-associated exonuclease Cas4